MNDSGARNNPGRKSGGEVQHLRLKLLVFAALCALPLYGALSLSLRGVSVIPLACYGVVSVLAFFLYWGDKRKARADTWRTPENILRSEEHTSELQSHHDLVCRL